mmetsp:Transcript_4439/g.12757  ORF Transcript_4439/g.12757 Transcript_4439/m.12757 type:complete len:131 (+) Transcript_4439:796-1188(+)
MGGYAIHSSCYVPALLSHPPSLPLLMIPPITSWSDATDDDRSAQPLGVCRRVVLIGHNLLCPAEDTLDQAFDHWHCKNSSSDISSSYHRDVRAVGLTAGRLHLRTKTSRARADSHFRHSVLQELFIFLVC